LRSDVISELQGGGTGQRTHGLPTSSVPHAIGRTFPLLLLFALQAGYWGGLGVTETSRFELLLGALAQIVALGFGFLWLAVGPYRRTTPWKIDREDQAPFVILIIWVLVACVAAAIGLLGHHPVQYVVGDFYKFAMLPMIFLLAYLTLENEPQLQLVVRWVPLVFGAVLVFDFLRFYPLLGQEHRFTSNAVNMIGGMAPLICYMVLYPPSRVFFVLAIGVFAEAMLALSFGQMIGGFMAFLISLGLFFTVKRRWLTVVLTVVVLVTFAINMLGAIPLGFHRAETRHDPSALMALSPPVRAVVGEAAQPVEPRAPFRVTKIEQYMFEKIREAVDRRSLGPAADIIGGSRAAEIKGVMREIAWHPRTGIFGFGLGGELLPVPLEDRPPTERPYYIVWETPKHYIHAGLFDVLYRGGFVGLAVFLAVLATIFVRGVRLARSHDYGVFVIVNVVAQGCLLALNEGLLTPYLLLALSFAGVAAIERDRRSRRDAAGPQVAR
jgi:hypothetical protein